MQKILKYIPLLFGLYAIAYWVVSTNQFLEYYYQLGIYDIHFIEFMIFIPPLFVPFVTLGALIVAIYIKRFRLYLWMRGNLETVEYDIDMPPAETGLVIDYFSSSREVIGTLLDLHYRNVIKMEVGGQSIHVEATGNNSNQLSVYESELMNEIFRYEKRRVFRSCDDKYLVRCARLAHKKLNAWAKETDSLMRVVPKKLEPLIPYFIVLAVAGFLVSLVTIWVFIFDYESAATLGPNVYPVHAVELVIIYAISLWGLLILLSGFLPEFSKEYKSKPVNTWIKANGLKMYLKTVHADRFSIENISEQPRSEIRKYAPYMITLNLAPCNTEYLKQILAIK